MGLDLNQRPLGYEPQEQLARLCLSMTYVVPVRWCSDGVPGCSVPNLFPELFPKSLAGERYARSGSRSQSAYHFSAKPPERNGARLNRK